MTTWYVDPINGVDANAGTSFATRCQTITGINAKALAAGDTVRFMKSPDPVDTGLTGSFGTNISITNISSPIGSEVSNFEGSVPLTLPATCTALSSVSYGNGALIWTTGSNTQTIYRSTNEGLTWSPITMPSRGSWSGTAYGNGRFAAVRYNTNIAAYSDDYGVTWTQVTTPTTQSWGSLHFAGGLFIALAPGSATIATSTDGATWVDRSAPSGQNWRAVTYGNGVWVGVSNTGTAFMSSSDGITWTARIAKLSASWYGIAYGAGLFVAVSSASTSINTSPDGVTWTGRTAPNSNAGCIKFNNGVFYLFAGSVWYTSIDGITWKTNASCGVGSNPTSMTIMSGDKIACVPSSGTTMVVLGNSLKNFTSPNTNDSTIVMGGNGTFYNTSLLINVFSSFTTGKAAYWDTRDPSGFDRVICKIKQNAGTLAAAGQYSITLCSDTVGNTTVYTIPLPAIKALNQWVSVSVDLGSTITAGTIKSAAFNVLADQGAVTFNVDNIMAVSSSGDVALTLDTMVASSVAGPWYPIQNVTPTQIQIALSPSTAQLNGGVNASGTIESPGEYPLYFRSPIVLPVAIQGATNTNTTFGAISKSGSLGLPITYSGGWDTTDMSTQTGDTYLNGGNGFGFFVSNASNKHYLSFDKLNPVNFYTAFNVSGAANWFTVTAKDVCGNGLNGFSFNFAGLANNHIISVDNLHSNQSVGLNLAATSPLTNAKIQITNVCNQGAQGINLLSPIIHGYVDVANCSYNTGHSFVSTGGFYGSEVKIGTSLNPGRNASATNLGAVIINNLYGSKLTVGPVSGLPITTAGGVAVSVAGDSDVILGSITSTTATGYYSIQMSGCDNVRLHLDGTYLPANNYGNVIRCNTNNNRLNVFGASLNSSNATGITSKIVYDSYNGVSGSYLISDPNGAVASDSVTRHTASGVSWKISPGANCVLPEYAIDFTLGQVYLPANVTSTVSIWMRRDSQTVFGGLKVRGRQLPGLVDTVVETSNANNTWTQYSVSLTPTTAGVVEVMAYGYGGGGTANCWFDDISIA